MKFKVLQGTFVNRQGSNIERYTRGQVFESNVNWAKRHPEKYLLVADDEPVSPTVGSSLQQSEAAASAPAPADTGKGLTKSSDRETYEAMTVDELKEYAAAEEIPLGKAKSKNEIIDVLIAAI